MIEKGSELFNVDLEINDEQPDQILMVGNLLSDSFPQVNFSNSDLEIIFNRTEDKLKQVLGRAKYYQLLTDAIRVFVEEDEPVNTPGSLLKGYTLYIKRAAEHMLSSGHLSASADVSSSNYQLATDEEVESMLNKLSTINLNKNLDEK